MLGFTPRGSQSLLGQVLKEYRKEHHLTQEELAYDLHVEPRTLRSWENERPTHGKPSAGGVQMDSQQQQNGPADEKPIIRIEGPNYTEMQWTVRVSIGPHHKTFSAETEEEAQKQMEQYLDQQIAELEKFRSRLKELLGKPKRNPWPDLES